jgi:hypothetical protein
MDIRAIEMFNQSINQKEQKKKVKAKTLKQGCE